jgi:subtilisin family serine protease
MSDPYAALGYHPADADAGGSGTHGTHVMDIAAGNGRGGGPEGVAPEADLIFVHLATGATAGLANLGDSSRILEAIDFIARASGGRPWVINLSVGSHGGPHDGRTLTEMAIDVALSRGTNRFLVQSTGNYYDGRIHTSGTLRRGEQRRLTFTIDPADVTPNELEVWYSGSDAFSVRVDSPSGATSSWVQLGGHADLIESGRSVGRLYHRTRDPNNGDHHIDLFLYPGASSGLWSVTLFAEKSESGVYHAWLERDEACGRCQVRFSASDADGFYTTGTLANGRLPLVVGAYDAHAQDRPLAPFSSCGPTRGVVLKPDLVAPGVGVLAARSAPAGARGNPGLFIRKSGTSMAAPHVTGAVALCLEGARRPLRSHDIRTLVLKSTDPADARGPDVIRYGRGYLNLEKVVRSVRSATPDTLAGGRRAPQLPRMVATSSLAQTGHVL